MVVDYQSAYEAVKIVLSNRDGQNTVTGSLKCGAITGISVLGASVFLGPVGVIAGAALGSTIAYLTHRNKFKSLFEVIEEDMSDEEREKLIENVQEVIQKFEVSDAITVLHLAQGNIDFQNELLYLLKRVITDWQNRQSNSFKGS